DQMKSFDKIVQVKAETVEQADELEPALKALPERPQLTVTDSEGGFREVYFEDPSKRSRAKAAMAFLDRHPGLINALDSTSAAPLHLATQFDDLELLEYLLAHKANINIVDGEGLTPLHLARNADAARRLIKAGAQLEARSPDGGTPLEFATSHVGYKPR